MRDMYELKQNVLSGKKAEDGREIDCGSRVAVEQAWMFGKLYLRACLRF